MTKAVQRTALTAVMIVMVATGLAYGDGKFFVREKVPADVPYQRAFLSFSDGRETLMLQSKYELAESTDSLGWIVPVPAVPEIDSMDAEDARAFLLSASMQTRPDVTHVLAYVVILLFAVSAAMCLRRVFEYPFLTKRGISKAVWGRQARLAAVLIVVSFLLMIGMSTTGKSWPRGWWRP
jgi:hypothetical protein